METTPFTYLVGWTAHNKFYYGVRYAKGTGPESLWVTYFTSSKTVKAFRKQYGEPDVIQIRKVFYEKSKAREWECRVLTRLNVPKNKKFLNKTKNITPETRSSDGLMVGFAGRKHTEETREKMRVSQAKRPPPSAETRAKIGAASVGRNTMLGKKHSEATKEKLRNISPTEEHREKIRIYRTGRKHSAETRAKMRAARARNTTINKLDLLTKIINIWIHPHINDT